VLRACWLGSRTRAASGRSDFPAQADWMVMGAIRNAEDEIFI
jgi:hypothetical protein